jgi:hypothetical protein
MIEKLPIPILSVLLFLNCIITIFMYNNSHCKDKGKNCNAYVKFPTPQQDANTQTITFDLKKAQPYCDPISNLKNSSTVAVLVFSSLFFIASAVVAGVGFSKYNANYDTTEKVWIILLAVLNLIVSAFNWTIYANCLDSMNCDTNKVNYVDGKGLIASCYKSIDNHGTYGMYVFMIVLLIASIGSTIGGIYTSLDP